MAMFREMERRSGSVPKPQTQVKRGPHFSAPKAALQAHVAREKSRKPEHGDEPHTGSRAPGSGWKASGNESSLPLLSPPTNPDFTAAASIDRSSSNGNGAFKGTGGSEHAGPPSREPAGDILTSLQDSYARGSPEKTFGVVLSSPNIGAIRTPERTPGGDSLVVPDMPRAGSNDVPVPEGDALTPFGVRLKKVPKTYEREVAGESPRQAQTERAPSPIVDSAAAPTRTSPPAAEPSSPKFSIPTFEEDTAEPAEAAAAAAADEPPVQPPEAAASPLPELNDDIFAQFGLTSQPAAPTPSSLPISTAPPEEPAAAAAPPPAQEEWTGIPSFHEPGLQPPSSESDAPLSAPAYSSDAPPLPEAAQQQLEQPQRPSAAEPSPRAGLSSSKSFRVAKPPPPADLGLPGVGEPLLEPAEDAGAPAEQAPPALASTGGDTPQKVEAADDSLAGLFSPLVATADDMQQYAPPVDPPSTLNPEVEGLNPQPETLIAEHAARPEMEVPHVQGDERGATRELPLWEVPVDSAGVLAAQDGGAMGAGHGDGQPGVQQEAFPAADSPAHAGVALGGSEELGAHGESVGVQMVLEEDFDRAMAQWQLAAAAHGPAGAPTPEQGKAVFAHHLATEIQSLLGVPLARICVVDVQRGSVVASVNLEKGAGPSPIELANLLIYQVGRALLLAGVSRAGLLLRVVCFECAGTLACARGASGRVLTLGGGVSAGYGRWPTGTRASCSMRA
jgi:hypothetical protein